MVDYFVGASHWVAAWALPSTPAQAWAFDSDVSGVSFVATGCGAFSSQMAQSQLNESCAGRTSSNRMAFTVISKPRVCVYSTVHTMIHGRGHESVCGVCF